jgi:hypothetical protein
MLRFVVGIIGELQTPHKTEHCNTPVKEIEENIHNVVDTSVKQYFATEL